MTLIFTAGRNDLAEAIARASAGLPSRPSNPVHAGMLIEESAHGIQLTAGDPQDMMFTATTEAEIHTAGTALLPGRMLTEISKYFTGNAVTIECGEDSAAVLSGRSRFVLSSGNPELYPAFPESPLPAAEIDAEEFSAAVRRVAPSAGKNSSGTALDSVCLSPRRGKLFMVATDTTRMAVAELPWEGDLPPVLVPPSCLERFARIAEGKISIGWSGSLISLTSPGLQVVSRLVQGKYPKWQTVMDRMPQEWITASGTDLIRALKVAQLAAGEHDGAEITLKGSDLIVSGSGDGSASDSVAITDYSGEEKTFLFSAQKILDGLSGDTVRLAFIKSHSDVLYMKAAGMSFMVQSRRDLKEEA